MFLRTLAICALFILAPQAFAAPQHVERAERPAARPWAGGTQTALKTPIEALIAKSRVSGRSTMVLIDMATGAVVESHGADVTMPPASVTKVVTALYAMHALGPDFGFTTRVVATGPVKGGWVEGDLVLVGGGDPALDSDEMVAMIKALRDKGVRGVRGRFLYYADALPNLREIDDGQPDNAGYNPGVSGLNLNFNRVYFEWKPENGRMALSLQARAEAHSSHVRGMTVVAANRDAPVYRYSEKGGADHWSIAASALKRPGGVWLPVRAPAAYAAEVFRTLAHHYGVTMPAPKAVRSVPTGMELARFTRRELRLVCRGMLHFSTNLTAEALGLRASGQRSLAASGHAMTGWARQKYGVRNALFRDHSGLGDHNRVSAGEMAGIVYQAGRAGHLDGILRRYFVAAPGGKKPAVEGAEVRAKTGTLNFVRGLSGIITGKRGQQYAFAIFSADLKARAASDGTLARPRGAKTFASRAKALEQLVLGDWLRRYGS